MPTPLQRPPEELESQLPYLAAIHSQWIRQEPTTKLIAFLEQHRKYLHARAIETRAVPDAAVKYLTREHFLTGLIAVIRDGNFMSPTAKPNPETY